MPDWALVFRDGGLIAVAASAYVMALLRLNPRLFLRHYPKEIRQAVPPLSATERKAGGLAALPLFLIIIGGPLLSAWLLDHRQPEPTALSVFWQAFAVAMVFNVVDLLVLDYVWLGVLRPRWALMPGAEAIPFRFNWLQHFRGFAVGSVLAVMIGLVALLLSGRW